MAAEPQGEPDLTTAAKVAYLPSIHRTLPSSEEAEQGVICSVFLNPPMVRAACEAAGISREHFFFPSTRTMFELVAEFWNDNEPLEDVSFTQVLRDRGLLATLGGRVAGAQWTADAFFTAVRTFVGTAHYVDKYIEILREKHILREVIKIGTEAASRGYDEQNDVPKLLSDTIASMMKIVRIAEGQKLQFHPMDELVRMSLDRFEAELTREKPEMPTGIHRLDYYTGGFVAPEIWVVMARSTQGKSALAVNIVEHLAIEHRKYVGYISLEMGAVQLTTRLIFSRASCNREEIKHRRYMTEEERESITKAATDVARAKDRIFIREDGALTPSEIAATASAWKTNYGLDVLFIDHAQLAKSDGKTSGRTEEVEAISRSMNPLAKRLNIAIVILSQVTVSSSTHKDAPDSYSAKNSKALEEDADKLLVISHTDTGSWIKIGKNREGEKGVNIPVTWNPELQRFSDRTEPKVEQPELVDMGKPAKRPKKS